MRAVALVSGGKDSCYNMMQCVAAGHTIVALANLQPEHKDELDSYMYQTVGHQGIELYAEAMELPLYREYITGNAVDLSRNYTPSEKDEVEDLFRLLSRVKDEISIEAVAVGAILSDYQRIRVENVCVRLGLVSLAYLWRRNQKELLHEMIENKVEAIIIKVAALGLDPKKHLGMTLSEIQPHLLALKEKYGVNVCGEGGEYETFTLDCPLFKKRLVIDEKELVMHADNPVDPVGYLNLKLHLEPKDDVKTELPPTVKSSLDFVNNLSDSVFSDVSDLELSETELESIEKLEKEEFKQDEINLLTYSGDNVDANVDSDSQDFEEEFVDDHGDEIQPVVDHMCIFGNEKGWYFVGGIVGVGEETAVATRDALNKLISLLDSKELQLPDVCSVNIYMRDMAEYSILNAAYADVFNFPNPPTRACVQCPLPRDIGLILEAIAHKAPSAEWEGSGRETLHVQGISHWAPANIGPYSQAVKVGEVILTCGQIALVPGSLRLAGGGARRQCTLALRHLARVLRAVHPAAHIRSVVQSVCYVQSAGAARGARRQLERRTAGALAQAAAVGALPRGAAVEWLAIAHTHNNRFDYEETGCDIDDYKVAITRRWNYENTVAAFVCNVATSSCASRAERARHCARAAAATASQLQRIIEYALGKLLEGCTHHQPALTLRIFYQSSAMGADGGPRVVEALRGARGGGALGAGAAGSAVPVRALHTAVTFLSISGLRLDE